MINNKTYATKATATRGAKRLNIANPEFVTLDNGRIEVRDANRPLYNNDARVKSKTAGPVGIVWDLCAEMITAGAKRSDIVGKAIAMGVSPNTAKTQYQYYRKAAGLVTSRAA